MEALIVIFSLFFLLFAALGIYAVVKAVEAAKRGVDRTITQARRTVEDHTLRAKSFVQPGAVGEIAQLRLNLRSSMRATQDALHAGVGQDESLKESLDLFRRLSVHGHELDAELKHLETEPDRTALTERLPELRRRTERIARSADSLRWAVRDRAHRFNGDDLDALSDQIDVETGALRHWETTGPSPWDGGTPPPGQEGFTAPPRPDASTADGPGGRRKGSGARRERSAEQDPRPSIAPKGGQPPYPWQKRPRPESTT